MVYTKRSRHRFFTNYMNDIRAAERMEKKSYSFPTIQKKNKQEEYHFLLETFLDENEIFFSDIQSEILFDGANRHVYCETTIIF